MHPADSLKKRRDHTKKEFKEFLEEEFEDPENSDVLIEKKNKKKKERA